MNVENITDSQSLQQVAQGEWYSIYLNGDFYRVCVDMNDPEDMYTAYTVENEPIEDDELRENVILMVSTYRSQEADE